MILVSFWPLMPVQKYHIRITIMELVFLPKFPEYVQKENAGLKGTEDNQTFSSQHTLVVMYWG